jgi:hypothetical protein
LKLPSSRLSKLADHQRKEVLKRNLEDPPKPLLKEVRQLILSKCAPEKEKQMRVIFEKQPFGELERLVTQKLLDAAKKIAKNELQSEKWLHSVARLSGKSYETMRVSILEFLDTDVFSISAENCASFLDPLIESWDIDLATFGVEIVLNRRLIPGYARKFELSKRKLFTISKNQASGSSSGTYPLMVENARHIYSKNCCCDESKYAVPAHVLSLGSVRSTSEQQARCF